MRLGLIAALALLASAAHAQNVSDAIAGEEQRKMLMRELGEVRAYAAHIGMSDYMSYCQTKMADELNLQPRFTGQVPWGVNYHAIDRQTLTITLQAREDFERSYLKLCLAEAKNALRDAERK
jgi:hypothetical protein